MNQETPVSQEASPEERLFRNLASDDAKSGAAAVAVYDAVAQILPTLGRDFHINVKCRSLGKERVSVSVDIYGITPMGKAIVPHMRTQLSQAIKNAVEENQK